MADLAQLFRTRRFPRDPAGAARRRSRRSVWPSYPAIDSPRTRLLPSGVAVEVSSFGIAPAIKCD
ncbi:hypothetical protein AArcCO_0805 [Halalkaliarchaeum sp. AArc-CO]|nr:hypothetical protein AArcCO_0805 [Halalkaliarchaeum sp. AArc-CO]